MRGGVVILGGSTQAPHSAVDRPFVWCRLCCRDHHGPTVCRLTALCFRAIVVFDVQATKGRSHGA
jgi:hypothetical protein